MSIVLDKHQVEAAEFVLEHKKAALFMGCGTGKTFTSLEIFKQAKPKKCLIITTARLIREDQWKEEIIDYFGYFPDNIELISHQMISRRSKEYIKKRYAMIVIDESHRIKSKAKMRGGTKITRLVKTLSERAEYVVPMTGTPVGNDYLDVFNTFRNCDIEMWHGWTEYEFIQAYYYHIMKDWSGAGFKVPVILGLKPSSEKYIWKLLREKAVVVKTEDVLDLKKQKFKILYVDGMNTTTMYKTIKKKMLKYEGFEDTLIALRRNNFLRQAANGFIYEETDERKSLIFNTNKINKFGEKIPGFLDTLGKMVVVYWFKEDRKQIEAKLDELGISYTDSKKQFAKDKQVFILHFSDSEGLNLQKISYGMLFYSYESSYMNFAQICGRIYRRGQEEQCYYIIMISRGTIEQKIWNNIKHKKEKDDFVKSDLKEE